MTTSRKDDQVMNSTATQPATITVPPPGAYRIDPSRSAITFTTRHLFGLGAVRGTFTLQAGEIHITDPPDESTAWARIPAASFLTGNASRDSAVRSTRLLDAGAYPDITFTSGPLERADGRWILRGLLSVRGVARPVDVLLEAVRSSGPELRLQASAHLDRYDFGVTRVKGLAARHLRCRLDVVAHRF
jgi:polyisoprenoid-binding protein YceI